MLKTLISLISVGCALVATAYTKPVTASSNMPATLTESSPGSYVVAVSIASPYITTKGRLVRIDGSDVVVECVGKPSSSARIKYDGFKTSCRFLASS